MKSIGSGNWDRESVKPIADDFLRFSIFALRQHGLLADSDFQQGLWRWVLSGGDCTLRYEINMRTAMPWVRVMYRNKANGAEYDYTIALSATHPHYGGKRWWFQCPVAGCGKRVGMLYLYEYLACRHCYDLAYRSQSESSYARMMTKAEKLHLQLGGDGSANDIPSKPKGMHWHTYHRKADAIERLSNASLIIESASMGIDMTDLYRL